MCFVECSPCNTGSTAAQRNRPCPHDCGLPMASRCHPDSLMNATIWSLRRSNCVRSRTAEKSRDRPCSELFDFHRRRQPGRQRLRTRWIAGKARHQTVKGLHSRSQRYGQSAAFDAGSGHDSSLAERVTDRQDRRSDQNDPADIATLPPHIGHTSISCGWRKDQPRQLNITTKAFCPAICQQRP